MHKVKADIVDIFSSIQGEGIFIGAKQIFVRFKACNLNCSFCDELKDARVKQYTSFELLSEIKFLELSKGPHHSISLTGGEPLLYTDFLKIFLKLLKKEKLKAYLETNGTLPDELSQVIDLVDIVAMDFKLPSSTGERPFWKEHLKFLKIALERNVFIKAVVTPHTKNTDIEKAVKLVKGIKRNVPFILQPATPVRKEDTEVPKDRLLRFMEIGTRNKVTNIRVIPQIHKILQAK